MRRRRRVPGMRPSSVLPVVLDQLRDHQAALGGRAAAARLIIFGREQFTPALRERSAAEGIHLVPAARLFEPQ
jgi:hypothetical protein